MIFFSFSSSSSLSLSFTSFFFYSSLIHSFHSLLPNISILPVFLFSFHSFRPFLFFRIGFFGGAPSFAFLSFALSRCFSVFPASSKSAWLVLFFLTSLTSLSTLSVSSVPSALEFFVYFFTSLSSPLPLSYCFLVFFLHLQTFTISFFPLSLSSMSLFFASLFLYTLPVPFILSVFLFPFLFPSTLLVSSISLSLFPLSFPFDSFLSS